MSWLFGFRGRFGRIEWWLMQIFSTMVAIAGIFIPYLNFANETNIDWAEAANYDPSQNSLTFIVTIPLLLIATWMPFAASVKRYHDRGKSGLWILIAFIPFGLLFFIIECGFFAGDDHDNYYGNIGPTTSKEALIASVYNGDNVRPDILARRNTPKTAMANQQVNEQKKPKTPVFGRRKNIHYPRNVAEVIDR